MQSIPFARASFLAVLAVSGALAATNVTTNYSRPLSFEPNRGQTNKRVDFRAHGAGYSLFLSRGEAVMAFKDGGAVRMSPVGAKISSPPEPLDEQPSKSNYFIGGSSTDSALQIALDNSANVYVVGSTLSSDFPTKNAFQSALNNPQGSAFVTKISAK